jgi:hypothetical protein
MALVDALGNLVRFVLLPGQRRDSIGVEPLITGLDFAALIGDKAFDNNWLRPTSMNAELPRLSRPRPIGLGASLMMPKCTNGANWSRTSSARSRHSAVSQPATKRPILVLPASSTSSPLSSQVDGCKQALVPHGARKNYQLTIVGIPSAKVFVIINGLPPQSPVLILGAPAVVF